MSCFQKTLNQSEDGTSTGAIRDIGQPRPVYLSNNLFSDKKRQFPIKCKIEHWRTGVMEAGPVCQVSPDQEGSSLQVLSEQSEISARTAKSRHGLSKTFSPQEIS